MRIRLLDEVKWFIQRGRRGWSDCDAWNWFVTNAKVQAEVLKYLRDDGIGGYPDHMTSKSYKNVLTQIIDTFKYIYDMDECNATAGGRVDTKKIKVGLDLYTKYYMMFWD